MTIVFCNDFFFFENVGMMWSLCKVGEGEGKVIDNFLAHKRMSLRRIWKCLKMRYLLVKHVFGASLESEIYVSDMKVSQVQQSKESTLFSDLVPRQKGLLVGNRSQESS